MFQHTAARRRLQRSIQHSTRRNKCFNTQPPEGGCRSIANPTLHHLLSFNTQPPEGGCKLNILTQATFMSFNTQPPEGGCLSLLINALTVSKFQHTAARRRLPLTPKRNVVRSIVSTHSRPKAAALRNMADRLKNGVSTHSRPKAAA